MREDIFDDEGNVSMRKLLGDGYTRGWFSNCPVRYRLFCGARSTKKSKVILGYEPIFKLLDNPLRNILVLRQNDSDNRQSTFANICNCIYELGLQSAFKVAVNPLCIEYKTTGQQIIFRGINNPTSLNSITFQNGLFTDIYIEEAFEVGSFVDFRKVDGSLRGKMPDGLVQQITLCFNAWDGESWLNKEFFEGRLKDDYSKLDQEDVTYLDYYDPDFVGFYGKGLYLHKSTYKINEFRDKEIYDESARQMRAKAPEIYKVEFLGMFGNTQAAVYPEWSDALFKPTIDLLGYTKTNGGKTQFDEIAIGIDTGLSDGAGRAVKVGKGEDAEKRVRAATTMVLCGLTADRQKVIMIDEYFHSNNKAENETNTDDRESVGLPEMAGRLVATLVRWAAQYPNLLSGRVCAYVDSADIGFRQVLEIKAREYGMMNVQFYASTKRSIQSRVDFDRLLMAYGDFLVGDRCQNLRREIRNARRGKKGEAREDGDDHALTACEYGRAVMTTKMTRWKGFKEH